MAVLEGITAEKRTLSETMEWVRAKKLEKMLWLLQ